MAELEALYKVYLAVCTEFNGDLGHDKSKAAHVE